MIQMPGGISNSAIKLRKAHPNVHVSIQL
jgi:hypothetical protein